ncbi:MAG: sulfite exporter TauE/SafE family protein [Pirellulales bacterium]|nr:sulfite exporter TauE/SafE family protein [Pirellulales bacterium]
MPSLPVTFTELFTALGLIVLGAIVQGSVGFGLAVVVAPFLLLINPVFLPGPVLLAVVFLTIMISVREREHIAWSEVNVSTVGRVVGMIPAAYAIKFASAQAYDMMFSLAVLAGVVISLTGWHVRLTMRNLFFAAIGSGFASTVSSVGGPPMALAYQHEEPAKIRGTLSAIFSIGTPISLSGLWWAGRFGRSEALVGVLLMPAILLGFRISRFTAARLDPKHTRPVILALSAAAAVAVMVKAVVQLLHP